jgi:type IV secretory pathway VirB10-like protein
MEQDANPPKIERRAALPLGLLPRHLQAWILCGLATLMILVLTLTSKQTPVKKQPVTTPPAAIEPNEARIREYRERIEVQSRRLFQEQAELSRAKASAAEADLKPVSPISSAPNSVARGISTPSVDFAPRERSEIEMEREKRNYQSLFASNISLSYRLAPPAAGVQRGSGARDVAIDSRLAEPDKKEPSEAPGGQGSTVRGQERNHDDDERINQQVGKTYRLFEGTVVETVLQNRLDGAFSGPVNCMVTTHVYSLNRQRLLIPQGARVLGEVKAVEAFGQRRLSVTFHRLVMPDGYSVSLDRVRGLNQVGETGLRDQVNNHYMQIFGVSIAIGAIGALAQSNTRAGIDYSGLDVYRQGVASSLSQSALHILDRYLSVLPTLTIREGQRVKIYLADDLLLPAYDNHRMPGDL